jgi:hypothetical protein
VVPHQSGEGRVRVIGPQHDLHARDRACSDGDRARGPATAEVTVTIPTLLAVSSSVVSISSGWWRLGIGLEPAPLDVRQASQALSPGREEVRY